MGKIIFITLTSIILSSCQPSDAVKTVTVENRYSVSIPSFLTEVHNLNEDASLQYQHAWKEFYVIVIDESKEEMEKALTVNNLTGSYSNDVDGYANLLLKGFEQAISVSSKSDLVDTLVNGMPAKLITISGRAEGINAYYALAFIEGKKHYYQIMTWTLDSKEYEYKENMNRILYSLKEF